MSEIDEAVVNTEVEDTTTTEPTTGEQEKSEDVLFNKMFGDDESTDEEADDESEEKSDEESDAGEDDTDVKPKRGAEARKEQLASEKEAINEEIRNLVAERNAALAEKAQIEQEMAQAQKQNELPTVEGLMDRVNELTGEYYTEFEAQAIVENLTLRQKIEDIENARQVEEIQRKINGSINNLAGEVNRALKDFPEFDSESSRYNKTLAERASTILEPSLVREPNSKQIIGSSIPVYELYKTLSTASKTSNRAGNATYSQQAQADVLGGSTGAGGRNESRDFINNFFDK